MRRICEHSECFYRIGLERTMEDQKPSEEQATLDLFSRELVNLRSISATKRHLVQRKTHPINGHWLHLLYS